MTELVGLIVLHVLLGLVLAAAVWSLGLAVLLATQSESREIGPAAAVFAYPIGLAAVFAAAFAVLLSPWAGVVAVAGGGALVFVLVTRAGRARPALRAASASVAWSLPFIVGFSVALGLVHHGATADVPSSAYGDYVFWATRVVSAAQSIVPFEDLLVAGRHATYVEGGSTFIGAALLPLPGVDVFLLQTTTFPTLMAASLAIGIALISPRGIGIAASRAGLLATLAVASIAYPSWLPESPPVALATPLAFSLFAIWQERFSLRFLVALAVVLAFDLYLTKGFVLLGLIAVLGVALARDHPSEIRGLLSGVRIAVGITAFAAFTLVLWKLGLLRGPTATLPEPSLQFVPAEAAGGLLDQFDGRDTQAAAPGIGVIGSLLLATALFRSRAFALLTILLVGLLASWTIVGYGFDLLIGIAVLLAALLLRTRPPLLDRDLMLYGTAAAFLAVSTWFRDIAGHRAGFVFVVLLGGALLAAFLAPERDFRAYGYTLVSVGGALLFGLSDLPFLGFSTLVAAVMVAVLLGGRARVAVAGTLAVAAVVVAALAMARDDFRLSEHQVTLTTDHFDIWRQTRELVPADALVFTSMTGETIDGDRGWNYYPGIAGRQLFIGGWYDGPLLVEPEERRRRFLVNAAVLSGRAEPESERLAHGFSSHYAVVRRNERVGPSFQRLYMNERFALYRIP